MKIVKAVAPYIHPGHLNFKTAPYEAWIAEGGKTAKAHYPWRLLHSLAYRYKLPSLWKCSKEARLRFVEPVSLSFDTFPDYATHEVIPMFWDCWPCYFEKVCAWLEKYNIRTAIFTSSQTAEKMRKRFPEMNIMYCPEGIDTSLYSEGKQLAERSIDVLEFGRSNEKVLNGTFPANVNHICTKVNGQFIYDNERLYAAMSDAKVTIALPRSITQPEIAGDIETLTQRYWENMLSRIVMVGRAPRELIDLIGYNPVIEWDGINATPLVENILNNIDEYQNLVDKNYQTAIKIASWNIRIKQIKQYLFEKGYQINI